MTSKNKIRGNNLEYETVYIAQKHGFEGKRAYASDGRALGHSEKVDVELKSPDGTLFLIQCKRKKVLPQWLCAEEFKRPSPRFDAVVTKQDGGKLLVLLPFEDFLELIAEKDDENT